MQWVISVSAHRLAAFADDSASCSWGNLDVRLQFDLFLRWEEVFLFQLPKYPTLGLEYKEGREEEWDTVKQNG